MPQLSSPASLITNTFTNTKKNARSATHLGNPTTVHDCPTHLLKHDGLSCTEVWSTPLRLWNFITSITYQSQLGKDGDHMSELLRFCVHRSLFYLVVS